MPTLIKLIRFWPLIKGLLKAIEAIIKEAQENKKVDKRLVKVLIDHVQELLRKKLIDLPGVDEDQWADWLQVIEDKFFPEEKK